MINNPAMTMPGAGIPGEGKLAMNVRPQYPMKPRLPASMGGGGDASTRGDEDFDGKRPRKSMMRKTVDYNSSFQYMLERRVWQRDFRDRRALQPDVMYYPQMLPPMNCEDNPANAVTTKFVKTATNKMR